jgi:hypothetical protein
VAWPAHAQSHAHPAPPTVRAAILVDSINQRMVHLRERLQRIDRQLIEQMTVRTRDESALRQHVRVRDLCASSDDALQHMQGSVAGMQKLLHDPALAGDAIMQKHVESLGSHWNEIVLHLDGSIRILEEMVRRMGDETVR